MVIAVDPIPAVSDRMMDCMKQRVSISIESDVLEAVRGEVDAGEAPNLSAAVESALREHTRARALDRLLEEFAAHHPGKPLTEAERDWARNALGGHEGSPA
jgi:Arc/MetJ-type ribon-helix-helix transcriptional regulator